jgi:hypothetical protein
MASPPLVASMATACPRAEHFSAGRQKPSGANGVHTLPVSSAAPPPKPRTNVALFAGAGGRCDRVMEAAVAAAVNAHSPTARRAPASATVVVGSPLCAHGSAAPDRGRCVVIRDSKRDKRDVVLAQERQQGLGALDAASCAERARQHWRYATRASRRAPSPTTTMATESLLTRP